MPRLAGMPLKVLARVLEVPGPGRLLARALLREAGVTTLHREAPSRPPVWLPRWENSSPPPAVAPPTGGAIRALHHAYLDGSLTPECVAEQFLEERERLDRHAPVLGAFMSLDSDDLMAQARAATARYRAGSPLSKLDGVPLAVKDEIDCLPYITSRGNTGLGRMPRADAPAVARLRAAGAVMAGKTQMHEAGLGVTGWNPRDGIVRNPWRADCYAGGSSGGSAAAVAAGLVPAALGTDGGGSIRIPASFCGVVGVKPTFGRVSRANGLLDSSLGHMGPIAATAADAATVLTAMAGPDREDGATRDAPSGDGVVPPSLLTVGVVRTWFDQAAPEMSAIRDAVCRILEHCGLGTTAIEPPEPPLGTVRAAHLATLLGEACGRPLPPGAGAVTRSLRAMGAALQAREFLAAQRIRGAIRDAWLSLFSEVDAVLMPATEGLAPPLPGVPDEEVLDADTMIRAMRPAVAANLTGLPAVVVRGGMAADGRPIGVQLVGQPWHELALLRIAAMVEQAREPAHPCYRAEYGWTGERRPLATTDKAH